MKRLLVDTSVWVDCFSRRPTPHLVESIRTARELGRLATTELVLLELLRGTRSVAEFRQLEEDLLSLHQLTTLSQHWRMATALAFLMGKKGFHPPSTDLLIAAVAVDYDCELLQCDRHFLHIARCAPLQVVT